MRINIYPYIILILIITGCTSQKPEKQNGLKTYNFDINIPSSIDHYTEWLTDINYLLIDYNETPINYITDVIETEDRIIIWLGTKQSMVPGKEILIYDKELHKIATIKEDGKSPYAPMDMVDMVYNTELKELSVIDHMGEKLWRYDNDGKFINSQKLTLKPIQIANFDSENYAIMWYTWDKIVDHRIGIYSIQEELITDTILAFREELHYGLSITYPMKKGGEQIFFHPHNSDSISILRSDSLTPYYRIYFGNKSLPSKFHQGFSRNVENYEDWAREIRDYVILGSVNFFKNFIIFVYGYMEEWSYAAINTSTEKMIKFKQEFLPSEYKIHFSAGGDRVAIPVEAIDFINDINNLQKKLGQADWDKLLLKYHDYAKIVNRITEEDNPVIIIGTINSDIFN